MNKSVISDPKGYIMEGTKFPSIQEDGSTVPENAIVSIRANPSYAEGGTTYDWEAFDGAGNRESITSQFIPSAVSGPKGDKGDTGPAGPRGEKGDTGPAGPKGDTGPEGPAGPRGETGETGPAGPKGDTGPAGPAGPKGDTGPAGPAGPKGDTGPAGPAGPKGDTGPAGPAGDGGTVPDINATASVTQDGETGVTVTKSGTAENVVLEFAFTGIAGGSSHVPDITATASAEPGDLAAVTVETTGDEHAKNIDFRFTVVNGKDGENGPAGPAGPKGDKGDIGPEGPAGSDGVTPNIGATASASEGDLGVSVTRSGTDAAPVLNFDFSIPGASGGGGITGNYEKIGSVSFSRLDEFGSGSYTTTFSGSVNIRKGSRVMVVPYTNSGASGSGKDSISYYRIAFDGNKKPVDIPHFNIAGSILRSGGTSSVSGKDFPPVFIIAQNDFNVSESEVDNVFDLKDCNIIGRNCMAFDFYEVT